MIVYYASFIWCGVKTIDSEFGSILYVKAENKGDAGEKIFDYIRKHYSISSIGYKVMQNPDKYSFSIMTKIL